MEDRDHGGGDMHGSLHLQFRGPRTAAELVELTGYRTWLRRDCNFDVVQDGRVMASRRCDRRYLTVAQFLGCRQTGSCISDELCPSIEFSNARPFERRRLTVWHLHNPVFSNNLPISL